MRPSLILRGLAVLCAAGLVLAIPTLAAGQISPALGLLTLPVTAGLVWYAGQVRLPVAPMAVGAVSLKMARAAVWERIAFFETDTHWRPLAKRITRDPTDPAVFNLHFDIAPEPLVMAVRVVNETPGQRFSTLCRPADADASDMGDIELNAYELEDTAAGGTRVHLAVQATQPSVLAALFCWVVNPAQDTLDHMKAVLDGVADRSIKGVLGGGTPEFDG